MTDDESEPTYCVHCPDCDYATTRDRSGAFAHQKRTPCPNCDRGVAVRALAAAGPELRSRALSDAGPSVRERRVAAD